MKIKLLTCLFVAGLFGLQQAAAQNYIVIEDFEDPDKITIPINNMTDGNVDNEDAFTVVDNPAPDDVNDSGQVLQFLRAHDGNVWAGFWSIPWDPLDMNEMKYTHYHVWKPRISTVKFKVEGSDNTLMILNSNPWKSRPSWRDGSTWHFTIRMRPATIR
jgi:hypothetical protein